METYYEKNLIVNNKEFSYKGIFRSDELFHAINTALVVRGYEKREKKTEEIVTEAGKQIHIELRPFKVKTNYARLMMKIKITLDKVTYVKENGFGYDQGEVQISFDSWSLTDYEERWGMKPWAYFLKGLINKFVYTFPLEPGFPEELKDDTAYVYAEIKKLFRSYRPDEKGVVKEEEIKAKVREEMEREEGE